MTELDEIAESTRQRWPGFWPLTRPQARALAELLLIHEESQTLTDNLTDSLMELNP